VLTQALIAQKFITKKVLQINGLDDFDKRMTAPSAVSALIDAAVEFRRPAGQGFADV